MALSKRRRAERDALVEENIDWARAIAAKVAKRLPDWFTAEELAGPADEALLELATKFDPSRGIGFRAYASRIIGHRCISAIRRKEYRERSHYSLEFLQEDPETANVESILSRAAVINRSQWPDELAALGEMKFVWQYVADLPARHRQILIWVYGQGENMKVCAERLGLHESRISQLHTEALRILRERMVLHAPKKAA